MSKKGVQMVSSTIIVLVLVMIVAGVLIWMFAKQGSNANSFTACSDRGGKCLSGNNVNVIGDHVTCKNSITLPLDCPDPRSQACCVFGDK